MMLDHKEAESQQSLQSLRDQVSPIKRIKNLKIPVQKNKMMTLKVQNLDHLLRSLYTELPITQHQV
jgi:hypothetical protein